MHDRVVRVVAYLFIAAALVVVTVSTTPQQPLLYVLVALALFVIVVGQEMLPRTLLGRWRMAVEAATMIVLVSVLVMLTGGYSSPFFVGYLLLVAGTSLWGEGYVPVIVAAGSCVAYVLSVFVAALIVGEPLPLPQLPQIGFIVVALGLVSYVAAVISREQRRTSEAALALSRYDPLTGLYSRGHFEAALDIEILRAGRSGRAFSLLLLDLDTLKYVNDTYGHESGDRLLGGIGEVIRGDVRATDVAARLGGDEFVIVLPETDLRGALRVADKLRRDIAALSVPTGGNLISSSVSVGVVTYPDDARTADDLVRRADRAMYEAKRRGKNQVVHYARRPPTPPQPAARSQEGEADEGGEGGPDDGATVSGEAPWDITAEAPRLRLLRAG